MLRGASPGPDGVALARSVTGKPLNSLELVERLCVASKPLAQMRLTHVQGVGALVPHVFMASVLERVGCCMAAPTEMARSEGRLEIDAILGVLEFAAVGADRDTRQLIADAFVREGAAAGFFRELRPLLGRRLEAMLRTGPRAAKQK